MPNNTLVKEKPSLFSALSFNKAFSNSSVSNTKMLVFVDRSLEDVMTLVAGVQPTAEVIFLDPQQDAVEQITQILSQRTAISSVHLVAHGSPGSLQLGSTELSLDTLERHSNQLQAWSNKLRGASLFIYGCQVASGQRGDKFLQGLHQLTQANIAASTDKVGSQEKGGNWQLDYQIGSITSELAFLPSVQATYPGVFVNYSESADGDISDDPDAPLALELEEGTNSLSASSSGGDLEYVTVTVPEGYQLDSVFLSSYASPDAVAFAAVQSGTTFTEPSEPPSAIDVGNLLGWSHFGSGQRGTDILDNIGNGSGAIGFDAPLPSGDYTFWLQQLGDLTNYTLDFNVSALDEPEPMTTVSFQTISGTFDGSDNILASELVRSLEEGTGASLLSFVFNVDGEIPEEGIVVDVNSDIDLTDYFTGLGTRPFSPGGQVLEAIYDPETGEATGFKFRIDQPNAIFSLRLLNDPEAEGEVPATFTLEAGEGYSVDPEATSSSVTFYDTLADVPAPTVVPEISFSVSETALVESEGNTTTVTFSLSEAPPPEGVLVYLASPSQFLGELNIFSAEVEGGVFPAPNFRSTGFFFRIFEQEASITLSAFPDNVDPTTGEESFEGLESFTLSLQAAPGYTIASDSEPITITIADTPESQTQVSLITSPATLVESEGTAGVITINLSSPPPEEGLEVILNAPDLDLEDFDLGTLVLEGAEFGGFTNEGLAFILTAQQAVINLPIIDDGVDEGLETVTLSVADGNYQIDANASEGTFNLVDTVDQSPPPTTIIEPNDTLELAVDTGLSAASPFVSFTSTLDHETINRYPLDGGGFFYIDATEDVDLYKVTLKAGDTIKIDADSNQFADGRKVDTWLRVFDSTGAELASNDDGAAPDEVFDAEFQSYIEFTAPADGVYYIGASLYSNGEYDPLTPGSGTGNGDIDPNEYGPGEYTLNISLNDPDAFIAEPTEIPDATGTGPAISLFALTGTYGNDFDNLGFDIIAPGLAENFPEGEEGGSALNFVLTASGDIPEGGIEVYINSDIALTDYFGGIEEGDYSVPYGGNLNGKPFSRGGQFLEAVYDENGKATGFKFLLEEPFATIVLNPSNREEAETDGPETATFSIVESAGYTASPISSSTVTFYDTVDQIPVPTTTPEVSLELSTTELIESEETQLTLTLTLSEPPPPEGVQVYVSGNAQDFLNEFTIFEAEFDGGVAVADGAVSGFYFQMFAQTATITLPVFNSIDITEGIEQFEVSLVPGAGYTVNPDSNGGVITIKDTSDAQLQVSLSSETGTLIESEGTVATLNLSLSAAPPEDGIVVTVEAPEWIEFDSETIEVTGGEFLEASDGSFTFKFTEQDATISFAVADDGEAESVEEATFTVVEAEGYQVSLDANSVTFTIVDTPESAPTSTEESNDTIATAIATGLSSDNTSVTFEGEIEQYFAEDAEGNELTVDASEDVDFYSFTLKAGEKVTIDVDSVEYEVEGLVPQRVDTELRLFNAAGEQLALNTNGYAPDEVFTAGRDSYLEFTATEEGTYYVGVAQWNNRTYDPNTLGTGSGRISPLTGVNVGPYTIDIELAPEDVTPVVSLTSTPESIEEGGELLTLNFTVDGTIPEDGLIIGTTELFDSQFDFNFDFEDPQYLSGIEFYDYIESETDGVTVLWKLTAPEAFIKLPAFDDNIAEEDATFTLSLREGEGYLVDPEANTTTTTITDEPSTIVGPTVSFSVEPTTLNEGDSLTITLNVDGEIPTEGLEVNIDSDTFAALGEFVIFDADGNLLVETEGIAGIPVGNEDASGFSVFVTESTATLTLDVLDDGPGDGVTTLDFALLPGENYDVDPAASEVTLTISDQLTPVFGTIDGDVFDAGLSEGFDGNKDIVFGGALNDLFDSVAGTGGNRLYGQSGDDVFILGSNDRAFGGAGDDQFYLLGSENVITGGAGADQFWVAVGETPEAAQTITDFDLGNDVIGISGLGIGFEDLTLSQDGSNALIASGDQELAKLLGINSTNLSADNFAFI